jgi:hypothetical protein
MLYSEIIAVCSEIHTKHINTEREQTAEMCNVLLRGYVSFPELVETAVDDRFRESLISSVMN